MRPTKMFELLGSSLMGRPNSEVGSQARYAGRLWIWLQTVLKLHCRAAWTMSGEDLGGGRWSKQ